MFLYIDTSAQGSVVVGLISDSQTDSTYQNLEKHSDLTLEIIEALLTKHQVDFDALSGIIVVNGPGSFTGLRVGVSIANTIGFVCNTPILALQKPVKTDGMSYLKSLKYESIARKLSANLEYLPVEPFYGSEPSITMR